MTTDVRVAAGPGVDPGFASRVESWAAEALGRAEGLPVPRGLCVTIWKSGDELRRFYQMEKAELGVITGEEADFLATHEAWRGYPRIHLCEERLAGIPHELIRGALHHEVGHALHHGGAQYYTFRFSNKLLEIGRWVGLDRARVQYLVYLLSVAVKDGDVIRWLAGAGLESAQVALLAHMMSDTEDERQSWAAARASPGLRKVVAAALLKTLLPVEALAAMGASETPSLRSRWEASYAWLPQSLRDGLGHQARRALDVRADTFQDRLEQVAMELLTDRGV